MKTKKIVLIIANILAGIWVVLSAVACVYYWIDLGNIKPVDIKMVYHHGQENLPSIENPNPIENKPDLNPIDKTNPYKNIKTNPFE